MNLRRHNDHCCSETKILNKGVQILEESQYLISLIKEANFAYVNKSEIDDTLLMSHIGLKSFEVCQSSVSKTITKMKINYERNS